MINQALKNSRRQLGELAVMQRRVNESEKRIIARAQARLDEVNARLDQIRPTAMKNSREYQDLIQERGTLNIVIAEAKRAIQ